MARIRSIKPSIWSDQRFVELSLQARLLCLGMISNADDDGRIIASGPSLIGAIFPHDDLTPRSVEKWRDEIAAVGLIRVYTQGRGIYAHFPNWERHQLIRKRQKSSLPDPPECETECSTDAKPSAALGAQEVRPGAKPAAARITRASDTEGDTERETDIAPTAHKTAPGTSPRRPPDEIWDTLLDVCAIDPHTIPDSARGAYNRAVADLRTIGATPNDIRRRAAIYRGQWPNVSLTPTALTRRWSECERPAPKTGPPPSRNGQILDAAMQRAEAAEQATAPRKAIG